MTNNNEMRANQLQIYRLFREDTAPTLIVYSKLLNEHDTPIIKYPKYSIWERMVVIPFIKFEETLGPLTNLISEIENKDPKNKETEMMGHEHIDHANSENYVDIDSLSSEEIAKMRKEL